MIKTKQDLKYYMEQDRLNLHQKKLKPAWHDEVWKYQIRLRKHEYYHNKEKKNIFDLLKLRHYKRKHHKWSMKYTTSIPINTCGPGLSIAHFGSIYINSKSKIGKNLRIQTGVTIANNVAIGANAVVVKDILEESTTHVGVPSHKSSDHSSLAYIDSRVLENK